MNHDKSWLDERIKLGEVPAHFAADAAKRRLETGFEADAAEMTESDRQILSELSPERFAAEVRRRAGSAKRIDTARRAGPSRAAWGSAVMAACLALAFVVVQKPGIPAVPTDLHPIETPSENGNPSVVAAAKVAVAGPATTENVKPGQPTDWRTKGSVELVLQRESPEGLKQVTNSDTLAAGARLHLSVPAALAWAAVYSIDSKGEMAQHWPMQGDKALALPQGALPRAWELDGTAGSETFVLVWSDKAFDLDAVRKAIFLHRDAPRVAKSLHVFVTRVRKEPGRNR